MAEHTVQTEPKGVTKPEAHGMPTTREETRYQIPPVDIYETTDGLTVVVDMPGVNKDQLDIRVDNRILTIRGAVKPAPRGDGMYNEFALLDYFRQFQLTEEVDQTKISAEYKHGVLTLRLPKAEKAKPRQINVQVS